MEGHCSALFLATVDDETARRLEFLGYVGARDDDETREFLHARHMRPPQGDDDATAERSVSD